MRSANRRGTASFSFLLLMLLLHVHIAAATRLPWFDHHFAHQLAVATEGPSISQLSLMESSSTSSTADVRMRKLQTDTTISGRPGTPGNRCC
ncbi:hypothetical protein GOP47_0024996 [Adiantum capillus-veneris]|uniref:Uncharacterized protein n=1 Tax=Adiantum capillus-veneris TaxID=13818 RepID=A0A9D4U2U6_ADICA|nr:hypothetical protein GOP47_0024996 [Adiantum capillus-veneris]